MSPPNATATNPHGTSSYSRTSLLLGSATSGGLELICFHPVDTIAKRLMSNKTVPIFSPQLPFQTSMQNMTRVIFGQNVSTTSTMFQRYLSLFPGLGFAAGYKVLQRVYKFGGQPVVKDYLKEHHQHRFSSIFGEKSAKTWMEAVAGSIVGVGEIVLLPLDVLKIKSQTNPATLHGKGVLELFLKEGRELYRGAGWTAARNAPGSFALFGGNQLGKTYICGLSDTATPTFFQFALSSVVGSVLSIVVSSPLDVIKTRVQNRPFDSPASGYTVVRELLRNEGMGAFFKGLIPKVGIVGPKLVFSFTIAQWLIETLNRTLH